MSGPIDLVCGYLDENAVVYELVEHSERFTAAAEARASGIALNSAAKDVVLRDGDAYVLAVIPASERLDLRKVQELLDGEDEVRLATETETAAAFPEFDVGALPPFGPIHDIPQLLDRQLLEHQQVLCAGGDHRHSLLVDPNEIVRLADARVADLCQS